MKTFILATVAALGLGLTAMNTADAGGLSFYVGGGTPYYGNSYGSGYGLGYSSGYLPSYGGYTNVYRPSYNVWHDTSHYDYVPTRVIPHGNHYHVQPGGYYYHQSGHVDRVHGNHVHHGW